MHDRGGPGRTRRRGARPATWLALGLLALVGGACAQAPPPPAQAVDPGDLRRLVGTWVGPARYGRATSGADPHTHTVTVRIREDGTFRYIYDNPPHAGLERHLRLAGHPGTFRYRDGTLVYDFTYGEGTVTYVESSSRRLLRLTGTGKGGHVDGAPVVVELTREP